MFILLIGGCGNQGSRSYSDNNESPAPYFRVREHEAHYAGPGRETPAPEDLAEVRVGWFGPDDPAHPFAGQMFLAAKMAVDEANADGGYQGRPFRLLPAWSESPWGSGVRDLTRLVYDQGIWAVVGGPDGPSAHLVEQVVAKARLPFISPVSTDQSVNLVNVPWMFSLAPSDDVLADVLAEAIAAVLRKRELLPGRETVLASATASNGTLPCGARLNTAGGLVVVSATDHDSRVFTDELTRDLLRQGILPRRRFDLMLGKEDHAALLKELGDSDAAVLALLAGSRDAAGFLIALRQAGLFMPVFGGPPMGRRTFVAAAGEYAEGVVFPLLWSPIDDGQRAGDFAARFQARFGIQPDYTAAYAYDAMYFLIAAIRLGGLNRPLIRDAVRDLSPRLGVTGVITWDATGQNQREVRLGTIRAGVPVMFSFPLRIDAAKPR